MGTQLAVQQADVAGLVVVVDAFKAAHPDSLLTEETRCRFKSDNAKRRTALV